MNQIRVLLAEDDQDHQRLLLLAIGAGRPLVSITVASDRDQLMAAARTMRFDCIVLDFRLPPFTAPELMRELAPLQEDVPCIVVSSSDDQDVVVESIREGVVDFVHKDDAVDRGVLWNRIERAIKQSQTERRERRQINRRMKVLETQASTDPLTGLLNRRAAERYLSGRDASSDRRGQVAIIMVDLDHFKHVNDTYGHEVGDSVLREAAAQLSEAADEADIVARWGGEEMLVIRQSSTTVDAWVWADRVRQRIAESVRLPDADDLQTASIGISVVPTRELSSDVVCRADRAMYLAKDSGRNRVCTWEMAEAMDAAHDLGSEAYITPRARLLSLVERMAQSLGPTQLEHVGPHGRLVRDLTSAVSNVLIDDASVRGMLELAAEFHDIGKVGIPEAVLAAPRRLTDGERRFVDEHARFGADLLEACGAPEVAVEAVRRHHDRFGVETSGDEGQLPELWCILSACDAVVSMLSPRPYSQARTPAQVLAEMKHESGRQFDPSVVDTIHGMPAGALLAA